MNPQHFSRDVAMRCSGLIEENEQSSICIGDGDSCCVNAFGWLKR
jgi:hypothetical protein